MGARAKGTGLALLIGIAALARGDLVAAEEADQRRVLVDTSLPFVPGAYEYRTDTPSVYVWPTYQAGVAAGWYYRFYPDASAKFSLSPRLGPDGVRVTCAERQGCEVFPEAGSPVTVTVSQGRKVPEAPAEGLDVALAYADWVLEGQGRGSSLAAPAPPAAPPQPAHAPDSAAATGEIAALQEALLRRGFDPGPVDGILGPRTRAAIEQAERIFGLPVTGRPSQALLARLQQPQPEPAGAVPVPPPPEDTEQGETAVAADSRIGLDCSLATSLTPRYYDNDSGEDRSGKLRAAASCGFFAVERLYLRGSVYYYPIPGQQQPWDPDYTYSIQYWPLSSWKLLLEYSNYSGNRWPWHHSEGTGDFIWSGSFRASYELPLPERLVASEQPGRPPWLTCAVGGGVTPRYYDDDSGEDRSGKLQLTTSCGLRLLERLTLRGTAYLYPIGRQQQPWDPDFTYTASYRLTEHLSIDYANYSGNRWPWHDTEGTGGFGTGAFTLSYNMRF